MQEPPENKECPPGSSWKFAKQSWNLLEFGSATTTSKQYNPGRVRNFPRHFQATVRNKVGVKFSRAKKAQCEIPPPPPLVWVSECLFFFGPISLPWKAPVGVCADGASDCLEQTHPDNPSLRISGSSELEELDLLCSADPADRRADLRNAATIACSPRQAAAGSVSTTEQLAFAAALTLVLQTCAS